MLLILALYVVFFAAGDAKVGGQRCIGGPGLPSNGGVTTYPPPRNFANGIPDGYTAFFGCGGSGKTLVGPTSSTCQDGTWSHRPGSCQGRQRCIGGPGLPSNGGVTTYPPPRGFANGIPDGYTAFFGCGGSGKTLVGPTSSTCQDGTWSQRPGSCQDTDDPLQIESDHRIYRKIISNTPKDYNTFASECTNLGEQWSPAILNSPAEHIFLKYAQTIFSDDRSYWLGGCTSTQPWSIISLSDYSVGDSCPNRVIISTWSHGRTYNLNIYRLKTLVPSYSISVYSILCERAKG